VVSCVYRSSDPVVVAAPGGTGNPEPGSPAPPVRGFSAIILRMASGGPGPKDPLFVSDGERNEAIERLNGFFSEGRLTFEELSARLDEAYSARTDVELEALFRGLPKPTPPPPKGMARFNLRRQANRIVGTATPAVVCTAIWAMTGHGAFWPEWVWLGTGVVLLGEQRGAGRRRHRQLEREHRARRPSIGMADRYALPPGAATQDRRRVLTVVFVDIVGSTEKALQVGDGAWREVLRHFEHVVGRELEAHHGRKLFTKGDEIVATFRTSGEAIRYACALREAMSPLNLALRTGIHTGELEGRRGDLTGIALHIGQRISASAAPDEILVSSTVRELAQGSPIQFSDRGEHELRGLEGAWHLYAVEGTGH
jgi:class 3 adenylate cyclase